MSKVLTSSPRRGRAAAASQDRLNVPSFKSSHFPPKTILFSGHCRRKGWVVEKGAALWPFRDSSIVNSDFFAGFSLVIFSSPFFCLHCSTGSAVMSNNPAHDHRHPSSMPQYSSFNDINNGKKTQTDHKLKQMHSLVMSNYMLNHCGELVFKPNIPIHCEPLARVDTEGPRNWSSHQGTTQ